MKKILYTSIFGLCLLLVAFVPVEKAKKIKLTVELKDCGAEDSLFLYQLEGFGYTKTYVGERKKGGVFEFRLPQTAAAFHYIGTSTSQLKSIILGTESEVKVKGSCSDITKAIVGSKINQDYEILKEQMTALKIEAGKKIQKLQGSQGDEGTQRMAIFELSEIDDKRIELLNEYKDKSPLLREIAALNTYLSFQNNSGSYYTEIDYFANQFFQFADFTNAALKHNPYIFEAFKEYAANLSSARIEKELHQSYIDDALSKIQPNSQTYQLALTGIVAALDETRHKNFLLYANRLIKEYEPQFPDMLAPLKQKVKGVSGSYASGDVAPDFTQKTPDGQDFKLSDLRGNIVLVDFWASWCGPCRRENPHVKKLYEKYHHKGFEILGVSLDRTAGSWKKAIEQDGLDWYHVSDLKGWKNEVAKMYSVSSIPHTILLDEEGRIIARKLRAVQLEQVLEQIFGS